MPNPLALLPNAVNQQRPQILFAQVCQTQPAPSSFDDPLYVTMPQWDPNTYFTIPEFPAIHGATLPQPGASCVLVIDDLRQMWCIYWSGQYSS